MKVKRNHKRDQVRFFPFVRPCLRLSADLTAGQVSVPATAGLLFVGTSGNISLFAGGGMGIAINNEYSVDATIPLGNIS